LQGRWCLASDPVVFAFNQTEPSLDEARREMRIVRQRDLIRIDVRGDAISVEDAGRLSADGLLRSSVRGESRSVTVTWRDGRAPPFLVATPLDVAHEDGALRFDFEGRTEYLLPENGASCVRSMPELVRGTATAFRALPPGSPRMEFAGAPPDQWPQVVLTNDASFRGHTSLEGASSFLVRGPHGVVVATAKHLIRAAGGVKPDLPLTEVDSSLVEWSVFPRTQAERAYRATRLAMRDLKAAENHDWLFLAGEPASELPATPLLARASRVELNERVFLIGCEYRDESCKQRVYGARVTGRMRDSFRLEFDVPVQVRGFSGAPVVDVNGAVVGVLSVSFSTFGAAEGELETGAEDVAVGLPFLAER
jgi:hypothetical protein